MIAQLGGDIRARLVADTTLTAIVPAASIYSEWVPADTALPYIVIMEGVTTNDPHFRTAREVTDFSVHWFVDSRPNTNTPVPVVTGRSIEVRVKGDWFSQTAGTAPSFGLDRWKPTLTGSGWSPDICLWRQTRRSDPPDRPVYRWIASFVTSPARAGA